MPKFIIQGGKPLKGEINICGAKNSATPIIAATMLTQEPCIIRNVPRIEDVHRMLEILTSMGGSCEWLDEHSVKIQNSELNPEKLKSDIICKLRSSSLLMGAMAARFKKFTMPVPGGCQIGARSLDAHLKPLSKLGVKIGIKNGYYEFERDVLSGKEIVMNEFSPTAAVNVLLAMLSAKGSSRILCADYGYSVSDLCWFLEKMGAKITGIGTHILDIEPQGELHGADYTLLPDPIEIGTFICLASATRSEIVLKNASIDFLPLAMEKFQEVNCNITVLKNNSFPHSHCASVNLLIKPTSKLLAIKKIHNMPYPGFAPDLLPPFAVLMTQAEGTSLIHDWMYEGRLKYIDELIKMGANATICDPHRALIVGPTPLYGREITSFDLRAGATLIIAALVAEGTSIIENIYQVDRGYEKIEERLKSIGAKIERVE